MMSSVSFIVMLLIMIIIPTILYTFFFLISCPTNPLVLLRCLRPGTGVETLVPRRSKMDEDEEGENKSNKEKDSVELVIASGSKLGQEVDCPICLAEFIEGEELRQLKICKHLFHRICIDKWLSSHCICPVCRAIVSNNQVKIMKDREMNRVLAARDFDRHDHWQGLPDSSGLV